MIAVLVILVLLAIAVTAIYLLGFGLGQQSVVSRYREVHEQSLRAQRDIGELTRAAFEAMADEVERRGRRP